METIRSNFFNDFDSLKRKITWAAWDKILASKQNGCLGVFGFAIDSHPVSFSSNWCSIVRELHLLSGKGFALYGSAIDFSYPYWDGNGTRFWLDKWFGDKPLMEIFPRLFALELDKEILVADKMKATLDLSFRRHVRNGSEHQQLEDLYAHMAVVSSSHLRTDGSVTCQVMVFF
ncbi:hypothetical protein Tco_1151829, partial [Tanacetum coccineum]